MAAAVHFHPVQPKVEVHAPAAPAVDAEVQAAQGRQRQREGARQDEAHRAPELLLFALCLWLGLLVSLPDVVAMPAAYSALLLCVRSWPLVHYEHCRRWTMLAVTTATFAVTRCLSTALLGTLGLAYCPEWMLWWLSLIHI